MQKVVPTTWVAVRSSSRTEWHSFKHRVESEGLRDVLSVSQTDAIEVLSRLMEFFAFDDGLEAVSLWPQFIDRLLDYAVFSRGNDVSQWLGKFVPFAREIAKVHIAM